MPQPIPLEILQRYWGYNNFRTGQEEVIEQVLAHKDCLAILPTGTGKSICYQIPALCLEGCALVISPLIALMQDQVTQLKEKNIAAAFIHSGLRFRETEIILHEAANGRIKLLYVSPERFTQKYFIEKMRSLRISFIAVDEAHCISQWGYDFRPSYLALALVIKELDCSVLALTATAPPAVKEDIISKLALNNAVQLIYSAARPRLSLSVAISENKIDKLQHILSRIRSSGLIYVRNRRITAETAEMLSNNGFSCDHYHAGLPHAERRQKFEDWMSGKIQFICCTTAFGMGIDKADVDIIVHLDLPMSLEEYYQEAGRAGRAGQKCYAVLLYNTRDLRRIEKTFESMFPPTEEIRFVYKCLCIHLDLADGSMMEYSKDFDLNAFIQKFQLNPEKTGHSLRILMQQGLIYLNGGVLNPSRIQILADDETLETYYNTKPECKIVLHTMLRMYEGILQTDVVIQEKQIAETANMNMTKLNGVLQQLQWENVIFYKEQTEKPQILILGHRQHSQQIRLDEKWLSQRKLAVKNQLQALTGYLQYEGCRQQYILQYLGETDAPTCQICDHCLRQKSREFPHELKQKWLEEILTMLRSSDSVTINKVYQHFPENKSHWVDEILTDLSHAHQITRQHDFIRIKRN
ncbi:MAG: RecQ family ATP-dependent DNA helicase [Saprospiraceae bacterium]|nr:RecQ family ATP-dependent DNA helicase [Saprospiraceae bacterium]HMW39701.1 ATP-dependent DNA helicase RecQ [Saprospiraceae bacterium]HMX88403.1 ATP-dependent DNA helicase RecQ [Saprospiraceae bacterium]HMZ39045.1 ATP-dependent DNA helicase RecQ [Saprospiraceae bacterium]HNA64544.1 ATP-dependent DNA helicase RecQ [Saprospiraceae bacterium]